MITMLTHLKALVRDEKAATAIEYGLIALLVGIAIIGGVTALGTDLNTLLGGLGDTLQNPAGN